MSRFLRWQAHEEKLWDELTAHRCIYCRERFSPVHGPDEAYSTDEGSVCVDCEKNHPEPVAEPDVLDEG